MMMSMLCFWPAADDKDNHDDEDVNDDNKDSDDDGDKGLGFGGTNINQIYTRGAVSERTSRSDHGD